MSGSMSGAARHQSVFDGWTARLFAGDRRALARAITAVENETTEAPAVLAAIHPRLGRARIVGFTGAPGAGKSTLVNAYIKELRRRGRTVGVVAVDPSSPISGGAILGDRIRMADHAGDPGVFVRSLAARGHLGGLSRTAARVIDVMDAAGRDYVVVETVGTGQSEVEIADLAHTKVVVCAPGLGDGIQAVKAGILEIADVLVVNKGDLPLAAAAANQLTEAARLNAGGTRPVPVLTTVATTGEGVAALAEAVEAHLAEGGGPRMAPLQRARRLVAALAAQRLKRRLAEAADPRLDALCQSALRGEIGFDEAAARALELLAGGGR
jgi:LAO/AO transport system kinase